jgi:hypothetical protein
MVHDAECCSGLSSDNRESKKCILPVSTGVFHYYTKTKQSHVNAVTGFMQRGWLLLRN